MVLIEMKLQDIKRKLKKYPYVTGAFFQQQAGSKNTIKNQLVEWIKSNDIVRLRNGLYTLNDDDRGAGLSQKLAANIIYYPSYVSLEYALNYYDMIPEAVFSLTSVSPKKTQKFSNKMGEFLYKKIRKDLFFGYVPVKDEFGYDVLIASPEKALLDFFYFNTPANARISGDYFENSLRLQNVEMLDVKKLKHFLDRFHSKKMSGILKTFLKWKETSWG